MPGITFYSKVMECSTSFEYSPNQVVGSEATFIFDNPHAFCTSDSMFYPNPESRNFPIGVFLFRCKRSTFGLFLQAAQSGRLQVCIPDIRCLDTVYRDKEKNKLCLLFFYHGFSH